MDMNFSFAYLFALVIFSAVGFAYFVYGKKEQDITFLITGIALMIYPYFVSGTLVVVIVGIVLSVVPFILRQLGW